MADLPILFSSPMVRAILREIEQPGTGKTQTRRVLDMPPMTFDAVFNDDGVWYVGDASTGHHYAKLPVRCRVGDRLYVREAWRTESRAYDDLSPSEMGGEETIIFEADADWKLNKTVGRLRQGMHMPRSASRITLIVTDVRVQRLREITGPDAVAEGVRSRLPENDIAVAEFMDLWNGLNSKRGYGWDANPWIAAYTFRPILGNIDQVRP